MESKPTIYQLEDMTEKELEAIITGPDSTNDARYVLGKMMCEGGHPNVTHNQNKGMNYLKEAARDGHFVASEYKTYWDIRFDRNPNMDKIMTSLLAMIEKSSNSARACNTLGEFAHA